MVSTNELQTEHHSTLYYSTHTDTYAIIKHAHQHTRPARIRDRPGRNGKAHSSYHYTYTHALHFSHHLCPPTAFRHYGHPSSLSLPLSPPLIFFTALTITQTFLLSSRTQPNPIHLYTLLHDLHTKVPRQIYKLVPHLFGANGGHMAASPLAQLSPCFHSLAFLRVDEGLKLRPVPIQGTSA